MTGKNWSISLENDEYENDIELIIKDAIVAIKETSKGFYVNLVTPAVFGNPNEYLTDVLVLHYGNDIETKFIDQCGCGGYVLRVWKK
jgi:putative CGCGG family rSAM target protein